MHRQLIAALEGDFADGLQPRAKSRGSAVAALQQPDNSGATGVPRHVELAEVASHVNVMHRQAKRAQKDCSDLYLLLLLHRCAAAMPVCCKLTTNTAGTRCAAEAA